MFNLPGFNLLMALLLSHVAVARAGGGEDLLLRSHTNTPHSGTATVEMGPSCRHGHEHLRHVMCVMRCHVHATYNRYGQTKRNQSDNTWTMKMLCSAMNSDVNVSWLVRCLMYCHVLVHCQQILSFSIYLFLVH